MNKKLTPQDIHIFQQHQEKPNQQIIISEHGEKLNSHTYHPNKETWTHHICGGRIQKQPISESAAVLHCTTCSMRIVIPKQITTLQQIKQHFKQWNQQ